MTRMRTNVSRATPKSVGNISRKRLARYFHMSLFAQPHRVELVVEVVAWRDRPAVHLRQVRDDPVPLKSVDDVRLVVEQALFELADELLALFDVRRACLPAVEVVDHGVLVLAVVGVRGADEAGQIQIWLDDESALEVHGDLEV